MPVKTYFIPIDDNACWGTQDEELAAKTARNTAIRQGGCKMTCINDDGGGHVAVFGADGKVKEVKPLERQEK